MTPLELSSNHDILITVISGIFMLFSATGFVGVWLKLRAYNKTRDAEALGTYMERGGKALIEGFKELAESCTIRADKLEEEFYELKDKYDELKRDLKKSKENETNCHDEKRKLEDKLKQLEEKISQIEQLPTVSTELSQCNQEEVILPYIPEPYIS